ncbi:MAG TPA: dihydrodipicolinate synthase family protein [Sphingobacteriaceae bacterium]|nr:dihydrodipicolinate synthase family protein [Sphingobacteriaceae bacterium]
MYKKTSGFIPVMLTPFRESGQVDYEGLGRLTEFYLKSGAAGLFANCLSSEMFELSASEQLEVVSYIVECTSHAVPVVATATFGGSIDHQADYVKRMYDTGIDSAIVITNMLAGRMDTETKFESNVHELMGKTEGIPLGFYECPDPFKRVLSAEVLGRLVDTGRVTYHKDTSLDIDSVRAKLNVTADNPAFGLYDAYMVNAVESLKAGAAGLSCIQGNYYPELVVWLCRHYDDPVYQSEVQLVQQFFIDHMEVMHHAYPVVAKYFLKLRGLEIGAFTRRPGDAFGVSEQQAMKKLQQDFAMLAEKVDYHILTKVK